MTPRVNFSINLRNVLEVNEVAETVSVETTLRMFWFITNKVSKNFHFFKS